MTPDEAPAPFTLASDLLYERAPCGLMTTRDNGIILRVNATLCAWLGFTVEELVGVKRLQDLLTVGCKIFHQTHWMPLLQIQGSVSEVQLELVHRDGRPLPMLVNGAMRSSDDGVRIDIAAIVATDRRKYERQLLEARKLAEERLESERQAQHELQEVLRAQEHQSRARAELAEQLIGIVSHDLRTPLNAVLLGATLLGTTGVNSSQARTIERIVAAVHRANRLTTDLLDFTQARLGGGLRVVCSEIDLHSLVLDCVEELQLAWPGRELEHRTLGPATTWGDTDRLAQVVTNLLANALSYGVPDRAVSITSQVDELGTQLTVHNIGAPIPEDLIPHLFEPLRRGAQAVKMGSRSVGLGLYIVHEIVTAHRGEISVRSSAADGTTFTVKLPARSVAGLAEVAETQ